MRKEPLGDSMTEYTTRHGLQVAAPLLELVENEILPGTGIASDALWSGAAKLINELMPTNQALLAKRDALQLELDNWHRAHAGSTINASEYREFLSSIGYLAATPDSVAISTENVDPEIASTAGPQLVVPVMNARFALNAANARWGSLYDALYGTDAISEDDGATRAGGYNPVRGDKVISFAKNFLNTAVPLTNGADYADVTGFSINNGSLCIKLNNGESSLQNAAQFIGFQGEPNAPTAVLLINNGLHIEIQIDASHAIGANDPAHIKDIVLEAAITTIQDCEDSVAAVDADDKTTVYRNWLGLMKGDLSDTFNKGGKEMTRTLVADRVYTTKDSESLTLPGRSVLLIRNVGHLMTNNAVLTKGGEEVPEGILDGIITSLCALHDLNKKGALSNSRTGSVYIVKPKMHGPEEVAFANHLFDKIEDLLNLKRNTLKIGIMDEERRTTVNLKACIAAAKERVIFINTGFLDRTGDEIHSDMEAGPVVRKAAMKQERWISAYEDWNVDVGLACGLKGRAQIGKGMWPMPDAMADMIATKQMHPEAGANCAWVPSPTAAVLHAMHYHSVNVSERQQALIGQQRAELDDLLTLPLLGDASSLGSDDIQQELDNNAQGLLGYVVRWVEHGVGCSKVPDINNVGLMEDRATLRISSQHMANWLRHGICSKEQIEETLARMAKVVDQQNAGDPNYTAMAENFETSPAFQAARDLVFKGVEQPSGYTEPLLHAWRIKAKAQGFK